MAAGISFLLLLVFVVAGLLLLAAVIGAIWLWRARERSPTAATCGQCGYAVEGLTTFICPECGSDLRRVGIHKPSAGQRTWILVGTLTAAALLVVMVLGCAGFFSFATVRSGPPAPAPLRPPATVPVAPVPTQL